MKIVKLRPHHYRIDADRGHYSVSISASENGITLVQGCCVITVPLNMVNVLIDVIDASLREALAPPIEVVITPETYKRKRKVHEGNVIPMEKRK